MENDGQSRYHKIDKPVFKSNIPPHLLARLDEKEKWQLETLSLLNQKSDWLMDRAADNNQANIEIDLRTLAVEKWQSAISSKWGMLVAVGVLVFTALVSSGASRLFDYFLKHP